MVEYSSIATNDVWVVVLKLVDRLVVGSWWIYKIKYVADGNMEEYKVRFMAKGCAQKEGVDYEETFAPIDNYTSIRYVISLAAQDEDVDPTLYRQLIDSLMYLVNTRPDICVVVNTLNQCMVGPKRVHWTTLRHILRYLYGIVEYGLRYTRGDGVMLCGFTDAN
eukprot:PITA_23976